MAKAERSTETRIPSKSNPAVGVRVWYGRAFVSGPDCSLRGWFFAVFGPEGEGDATGPWNGREGKAECEALARETAAAL